MTLTAIAGFQDQSDSSLGAGLNGVCAPTRALQAGMIAAATTAAAGVEAGARPRRSIRLLGGCPGVLRVTWV